MLSVKELSDFDVFYARSTEKTCLSSQITSMWLSAISEVRIGESMTVSNDRRPDWWHNIAVFEYETTNDYLCIECHNSVCLFNH